jgi:hypothetical protein
MISAAFQKCLITVAHSGGCKFEQADLSGMKSPFSDPDLA